jgi:hypothetical protein
MDKLLLIKILRKTLKYTLLFIVFALKIFAFKHKQRSAYLRKADKEYHEHLISINKTYE